MLDTGATANFIHQDLVKTHGIQTIPRKEPLTTKDIHGRALAVITEQAVFRLQTHSHIETIVMDIMPTRQHLLVLGMPWMEAHNPWIWMADRDLVFSLQYCQENCLNIDPHVRLEQPPTRQDNAEVYGVDGTTFTNPSPYVPMELHPFLDVFDDQWAKQMPKD